MNSSIRNKTVRPGSLRGYSYYYSGRQAATPAKPAAPAKTSHRKRLVLMAALLVFVGFWSGFRDNNSPNSQAPQKPIASPGAAVTTTAQTNAQTATTNYCAGNTLDKLIKISVDQRHLWACEAGKTVHDAPIITGLRNDPETETPLGTYRVYAKQTNTTLKGTDSRGSWSYPVHFWMPFLDNQYGTYGFHDATWRADNAFGNISPDSTDASHGCIELSLTSAKWLYAWAPIHTTITVES